MSQSHLQSYERNGSFALESLLPASDSSHTTDIKVSTDSYPTLFTWLHNPPTEVAEILDSSKSLTADPSCEFETGNFISFDKNSEKTSVPSMAPTNAEYSLNSDKQHSQFHGSEMLCTDATISPKSLAMEENFPCVSEFQSSTDLNSQYQVLTYTDSGRIQINGTTKSLENIQIPEVVSSASWERVESPNTSKHTMILSVQKNCTPHSTGKRDQNKEMMESECSYNKFIHLFSNTNERNFSIVLVTFLREFHHQIPLGYLFNLLYNNKNTGTEPHSSIPLRDEEAFQSHNGKNKGLEICQLIVEAFQNPLSNKKLNIGKAKRSPVSLINCHELFRTFLAIKIIFGCIKKSDNFSKDDRKLPKISIYKVYYILCQRLMREGSSITRCVGENLILGQARFGQLSKLVHPNMVLKRLGKRGKSKFHYMGITWNRSIVDEEVLKLVHLDVPQLRNYFSNLPEKFGHTRQMYNLQKRLSRPQKNFPSVGKEQGQTHTRTELITPSSSYCDASLTYPDINCAPRSWKVTANKVPELSQWSQRTMKTSLEVLKLQNVDLGPLIKNIRGGDCFDEKDNTLFWGFCKALTVLRTNLAEKKMYMHLYLVTLLMVFPVILASDEEVSPALKVPFRRKMSNFVSKIGSEIVHLQPTDQRCLETFITIMRKMIRVNELTSCKVQPQYKEDTRKQMVYDLEVSGNVSDSLRRSKLEETFISSMVLSMNAYNFKTTDTASATCEMDIIDNIYSSAKNFKNSAMIAKDMLAKSAASANTRGSSQVKQNVPYQVFKIAIQTFHEITLADPLILKLPMSMITFIIGRELNMLQWSSFYAFGKRDRVLSREIFKAWWIVSSMLHEYANIISEVVALSKAVSEF
ncbi:hypothetical protein JCM33374_g1308 [Metschnikowia sp. JCM 33374]|nr:hypothetical protein JCM33374_g1308 [Metschnikowia sp. JCM 33374]